MSLRNMEQKYQKESEKSVEVKRLLDAHTATYPEARADYDKKRPEVIRLTGELNTVRAAEGKSENYKELEAELKKAIRKRDRPLVEFGNLKSDLTLELERLVHPFITEESQRWEDETNKVKSEIEHREVPKEKEEPGVFSIGGAHKVLTNRKAVSLFRIKSQENLNHLRDMVHSSIPEIEQFIEKAEAEMREINLNPVVIEMDEKEFQHDRLDSGKEPGKTETGYVAKDTIIVPKADAGQSEEDHLIGAFSDLKRRIK